MSGGQDWLATRSGQLFGCYVLAGLILFTVGAPDKDTSGKLLFLIIGAVLRDMQDARGNPPLPNQSAPPTGQKETT
jgi:hypothetical protein